MKKTYLLVAMILLLIGVVSSAGVWRIPSGTAEAHMMLPVAGGVTPDAPAIAGPTTSVLDDFNRADQGPPPSSNWTTLGGGDLVVASNELAAGDAGACTYYWNAASFGPNFEAFITLTDTGSASFNVWLMNTTTYNGYGMAFNLNDDNARIVLVNTAVQSNLTSVSHVAAIGNTYWIHKYGTTLTLFYKTSGGSWTELTSTTDATYSDSGCYLVVTIFNIGSQLDDFGGGASEEL